MDIAPYRILRFVVCSLNETCIIRFWMHDGVMRILVEIRGKVERNGGTSLTTARYNDEMIVFYSFFIFYLGGREG